MNATIFEAPVRDGVIPIPPQYRNGSFHPVAQVILRSESSAESAPANPPFRAVGPDIPYDQIQWPDLEFLEARRRKIFGNSRPRSNPILEEREESRW